jgi:hypothetical protein
VKKFLLLVVALSLGFGRCQAAPSVISTITRLTEKQVTPRLSLSEASLLPLSGPRVQRHPALAYGGRQYLLVWQDGFNGAGGASDILAVRIAESGKPLDEKPIRVAVANGIQDSPAVAFCGGRFLVVWSDFRNGTDYDVYAAFVAPDGKVTPPNGFLLAGGKGGQLCPALATDGADQFLVVWQSFGKDCYRVDATRLSAASGEVVDRTPFEVMARGERPQVSWNGQNYQVAQKWYGGVGVTGDGKVQGQSRLLWGSKSVGWNTAASAWGRSFSFFCTKPFPDPWGWGGGGSIVGVSVLPSGESPEKGWAAEFKNLHAAEPDGRVKNVLDATQWRNHPGWPMGMRGGLKGTHDNEWPSGQVAATFNGRSLVCVWPRAHLVDNRRLANRDLYLTRVLPDWGLVDRPPLKIVAAATEEANPVLCAGMEGLALLAYEKVEFDGVGIEYRLLTEAEDRDPPRIEYVVPKSDAELMVVFDEPLDPATAVIAGNYQIDGLAVKAAAWSDDNRGLQREVILTTTPPVPGRSYTLRVLGVRDRSPNGNPTGVATYEFAAKPGVFQRGNFIERWAVLGPLARDVVRHPALPETLAPVVGQRVGEGTWSEMKGPVLDFGAAYGENGTQMAYAAVQVFSDRPQPVLLRLDSNDHNRAWQNGRLVHDGMTRAVGSRGFHDSTDEIPLNLQKGWNSILVQVENQTGGWLLIGQVTDAHGRPIRDLTWSINAAN